MKSNVSMDELFDISLKDFYRYKKYDDEEFRFLVYPNVDPHKYVVSNHGRLFKFISGKELKTYYDKDGYVRVSISKQNGGTTTAGMHRLVASTFIPNLSNLPLVNHLDGVKTNNFYKNLEWSTPLENTRHSIRMGLQVNSGPKAPGAKHPEGLIRLICSSLESGLDLFETYKVVIHSEFYDMKKHNITGTGIEDMNMYQTIYKIANKQTQRGISSEYNIPDIIRSKTYPRFTSEEEYQLKELVAAGYSTSEIIHIYGGKSSKEPIGKRIFDKLQCIKREWVNDNLDK